MDKKEKLQSIDLRPETDKDLEFLCKVYADSRMDEMSLSGWNAEEIDDFLGQQFKLQHGQYISNYKDARFDIILYNKEPAGRLYVHRKKDDIRIIDIALLKKFQRKGIGSGIMKDLMAEADEKNLPLSLHVEHNNPAMGLYERLGFKKGDLTGVYYFMERPASKKNKKKSTL